MMSNGRKQTNPYGKVRIGGSSGIEVRLPLWQALITFVF